MKGLAIILAAHGSTSAEISLGPFTTHGQPQYNSFGLRLQGKSKAVAVGDR
jgi:hypothetical protein